MIFAKKLCFEDMPYMPAPGEVIIESNPGYTGEHVNTGRLYQRGRYKVEIRGGLSYNADGWKPYGMSVITEMDTPFYIDAYIGGGSTDRLTDGINPYSGTGKANSSKNNHGGSDGIFGGAAGCGHDQGEAWATGGGNAVGNSTGDLSGGYDCKGSAGSACWFVAKDKQVGDLTETGEADAYRCFHCGGNGSLSPKTYIYGGGGGAYGGGAGGTGYRTQSTVGGSGTGGSGGGRSTDGNGIGAGRANRQGGLAFFDGQKWIDVFNDMQQGDGLGYNTDLPSFRVTYIGGSEISEDYTDVNVNINSGGYDEENERGVKYVGFYWSNDGSPGQIQANVLLDVSEAGQYTTKLNIIKKGTIVNVLLWGWFNDALRANEYDFHKILCQQFTASEDTPTINIDAVVRQLTLGINTGPISGLANSQDSEQGGMHLFFDNATNVLGDGSVIQHQSFLSTLSIGDTPTEVPSTITVEPYGVTTEKLHVAGLTGPMPPFDTRLQLITEGFQTYLAVEPESYTVQENVLTYYWTVTYYLQTDVTAGELGGTTETVDNGLLTDTIETDSTQGELPEIGIW